MNEHRQKLPVRRIFTPYLSSTDLSYGVLPGVGGDKFANGALLTKIHQNKNTVKHANGWDGEPLTIEKYNK